MAVVHLTQKEVEKAEWSGKTQFIRDSETKGLILSVNKTSKTWKVQRDQRTDGRVRTVRHTLGDTRDISLKDARSRANILLDQIRTGRNPNDADKPKMGNGPASWTVGQMWGEYITHIRERGRQYSTISSMEYQLEKYLADWRDKPIAGLKKSDLRQRHEFITDNNGPYPANQTMRSFRAAFNFAIKRDDDDALQANPVIGVDFNAERRREANIAPDDLADWATKVRALPNPLRSKMHLLGLFSGLRPGSLISIEREWLDLDGQAIHFPRMKSGRKFSLPLSAYMVELVGEALTISKALFPTAPWLFPTRSNDGKEVICSQVWRERKLASQTGHILRHTYRTQAEAIGVPTSIARALLDHRQPGLEDHYVHSSGLWNSLIAQQEKMTDHLLKTIHG